LRNSKKGTKSDNLWKADNSEIPEIVVEKSEKLALLVMYLTTQDFLAWIKYRSTLFLERNFPKITVTWSFFQSNIFVEKGESWLKVTLINYKPENGAWQAKMPLPTDNKKNVTAVFSINLDKGPEKDPGEITITIGKKHKKYKKHMRKAAKEKLWGIFNADTKTCIKFCDTMPTW